MPVIIVTNKELRPATKAATLPEVTKKDLDLREVYAKVDGLRSSGRLAELQQLLVSLHSSNKVPTKAKSSLGVAINRVTGLKETEALFGTRSTKKALDGLRESISSAFLSIAALSEVEKGERTRQEVAEQRFRESAAEIFRSQNSPEAALLKKMISEKGFAVGKAPVVFVLNGLINAAEVKMHMNAEVTGGYLMLRSATVLGVNKEFTEERSFKSMKDALQLMVSTWNVKNNNRYYVFDTYMPWAHALWALALPKSDVNVLHRAAGGRFRPANWGFGFAS